MPLDVHGVWNEGVFGAGIRVAVLDTGVATTRGLPAHRVLHFSPDGAPLAAPEPISNPHGTSCASLIGSSWASAPGVAPQATLLSFRVDGPSGRPSIRKIRAVLDRGARAAKADILSCSFVLSAVDPALAASIERAYASGIFIAGAAGNDADDVTAFPEHTPHVVAVAAIDEIGQALAGARQGLWIDVAAPGDKLRVVTPGGSVGLWRGRSSGATALVCGVAALMLSAVKPRVRRRIAQALPSLMQSTATDLADRGHDEQTGAGRIHPLHLLGAVRALERLLDATAPSRASAR